MKYSRIPAPVVDHQALVATGLSADIGKIDPWEPLERRDQHIALRIEQPCDGAGRKDSPRPLANDPQLEGYASVAIEHRIAAPDQTIAMLQNARNDR
jgi:hypothetical protein